MIVTLTPNPALDVTYEVAALVPHTSHRVAVVSELAGGKGLNVASVLSQRGVSVLATGPVGGSAGASLKADLEARGIPHDLLETRTTTRRTVTVVSRADGEATAFNEPGPTVAADDWEALLAHTTALLAAHRATVLVGSGSVPPGFPDDGYAQLVRAGREAGCAVVVDASRGALLGALGAEPDVVKPNRHELAEATGTHDPLSGALQLQDLGARHVVVSLGADGLMLVRPGGEVLRGSLEEHLQGNPTGAGDAAVAAIAAGLVIGADWEHMLTDAVAWSAAAVLQPVAGMVSDEDVARLRSRVRVWRS